MTSKSTVTTIIATANNNSSSSIDAASDTTCRYPSKKCWNERVVKRNGELHNLCEYHRQKANKNQRRLELKRRVEKEPVKRGRRPNGYKTEHVANKAVTPSTTTKDQASVAIAAPAASMFDLPSHGQLSLPLPWPLAVPMPEPKPFFPELMPVFNHVEGERSSMASPIDIMTIDAMMNPLDDTNHHFGVDLIADDEFELLWTLDELQMMQ